MIPSWTASAAVARPVRTSPTVGCGVGVDVEVVRQVALRVEVDREHAQARAAEDVGERAHRRRLAGAALLGEDRDRVSHSARFHGRAPRRGRPAGPGGRSVAPRCGRAGGPRRRASAARSRKCRRWRPTTISSPSLQHAPLDALAVDEHAVEAAVVEHPHAVGLAHDQRVAARHRRVVEADVGGEAAPDARPLALEGDDAHARRRRARRGTRPGRRSARRAAASQLVTLLLVRLGRPTGAGSAPPVNSDARTKRAPPQPGQAGSSSAAARETT